MNGNYYGNPTFPGNTNYSDNNNVVLNDGEMSYIENIIRLNKGKTVVVYASFPDSQEWKDKAFKGIVEEAGRDHIIISNPTNGEWYLIPMIYMNYISFNEKINYSHSYSEKTF